MDKLARKNKNARERIIKPLKTQGGIIVDQPEKPYRIRGDIYPGRIAAVAWPREVRL